MLLDLSIMLATKSHIILTNPKYLQLFFASNAEILFVFFLDGVQELCSWVPLGIQKYRFNWHQHACISERRCSNTSVDPKDSSGRFHPNKEHASLQFALLGERFSLGESTDSCLRSYFPIYHVFIPIYQSVLNKYVFLFLHSVLSTVAETV